MYNIAGNPLRLFSCQSHVKSISIFGQVILIDQINKRHHYPGFDIDSQSSCDMSDIGICNLKTISVNEACSQITKSNNAPLIHKLIIHA